MVQSGPVDVNQLTKEHTTMPVDPTDLGTAVCRALMRDMDDKPIALELYNPRDPSRRLYEETTESKNTFALQWCAVLMPLPDMVSVRAHLKYWGLGIWDRAELSPDADPSFRELIFVRYPDDPAQITAGPYEAALREATEKALRAAEADRTQVQAEFAAKRVSR
jgi:hypothetical protein